MILSLVRFLILSIPTAYEIWNEKTGEKPKVKWLSMFVRVVIAIGSTWVAAVFKNDNLLLDLIKSGVMAFAIFFLTFDYLFNIIFHRKTRVWYLYLSKSPLDQKWSKVNWKVRMVIRLVIFSSALVWYFKDIKDVG